MKKTPMLTSLWSTVFPWGTPKVLPSGRCPVGGLQ